MTWTLKVSNKWLAGARASLKQMGAAAPICSIFVIAPPVLRVLKPPARLPKFPARRGERSRQEQCTGRAAWEYAKARGAPIGVAYSAPELLEQSCVLSNRPRQRLCWLCEGPIDEPEEAGSAQHSFTEKHVRCMRQNSNGGFAAVMTAPSSRTWIHPARN